MGRACSTNETKMNTCRILMGKPEGKKPLGKFTCRWEDNIKTVLSKSRMSWYVLN
jgi:hypothetical protein